MKEQAEKILALLVVIMVLPCIITFLLSGRMSRIYDDIRNQADYITVKTPSGTNEMNPEEYVMGITAAEIPCDYELEAIKAQMVLVRTNLYRKIREGKDYDQNYIPLAELEIKGFGDKLKKASKQTKGQILTYQEQPIMASYHALSAGTTRNAAEVLGEGSFPYLESKKCPSDLKAEKYEMSIQIDDSWKNLKIEKRDSAGYVLQLKMGNTKMSGEEFRMILGLASSDFRLEVNGGGVFLTTYGIGHGLGMSQYTAQQMALSGKNYQEILGYFFENVKLEKI